MVRAGDLDGSMGDYVVRAGDFDAPMGDFMVSTGDSEDRMGGFINLLTTTLTTVPIHATIYSQTLVGAATS